MDDQPRVPEIPESASHEEIVATYARLLDEAHSALRKQAEAFHRISHDLRNPLSSISMRVELLLEKVAPNSDVRPEVEAIGRSCERMKVLLRESASLLASSSHPDRATAA